MPRPIALLTDFGTRDAYVGQMKAVLAREVPGSAVLDLTHEVEPYNTVQAGFFLAASYAYYPDGTVFAAVVDPSVGSARKIALLVKHNRFFLAPDNGLLSLLLETPGEAKVFDLSQAAAKYASSATFHGRDIFAPLAAKLARGVDPHEFGRRLDVSELARFELSRPRVDVGTLDTPVLHVDRFGNAVLNLPIDDWCDRLREARDLRLTSPESVPVVPVVAYAELEDAELGLLAGSQGFMELAYNRRSAAKNLALRIGGVVTLAWDELS